ncbi:MAG: hypothetical protein E7558_08155 [Ruminococcaceae bacterium]|nr:hypothetical protein [Oscillospiraceae bacterium]
MKQSSKTAICGMIAALSVVIMMLTIIPVMTYAAPAFAGILLMVVVIEINKKWAFGVYAAAGILSLLLATDKEAAVMYVAFFGYYPIIKAVLESKLPRAVEWIVKFLIFNVTMVASYFVLIKVFGISMEDMNELGKYGPLILLALGNVVFVVFDIAITRIATLYIIKWQKQFRRLFK